MSRALRVSLVGAVLLAVLAAGPSSARPGGPAVAGPVVGQVSALGGSNLLFLQGPNGTRQALHKGDDLGFGDVVLAGKGVTATLQVAPPDESFSGKQLIYLKPVGTTFHVFSVTRGATTTVIKITS